MEEESTGMDNMTRTFVLIDVLAAALIIGVGTLVFLNYRKKKAVTA